MSIDHFKPQIWSAQLQVALRKTLVHGGLGVINRDYEGEIRNAGDTVRITSISRPTIGNYVPGQTVIQPQSLATGQRSLVIDQSKYWAFEVDDVDAAQAKGDFMAEAGDEAGFGVADVVDQYIAGFYTQIPSGQFANNGVAIEINVGDAATEADYRRVYDKVLVPLKVQLDEQNVPLTGRYVILPPWVHGGLLRDSRFIENDKSADPSSLRNGQVGRASGFDILLSNNTPVVGGESIIQAGTGRAITFAEQISKTEAYRPESSFSDALKGLALYGGKVVRPDCLVAAKVAPDA